MDADLKSQIDIVATTDEHALAYVAEMCAELQRVAARPGLDLIRYLLDMARLEAERAAKERRG